MIHILKKTYRASNHFTSANAPLRNRSKFRRLLVEPLEDRRLMNVDWRNPVDSLDVNNDGSVAPMDALLVINYLNSRESRSLAAVHDPSKPYVDVTGDQAVSPLDALLVINQLNVKLGVRDLSESSGLFGQESNLTITLGQSTGTRNYRVQIDTIFDTSDTSSALEDLLAVYLVDPRNPTTTLLDRGINGTALFTLAGTHAEAIPGRVRWDGSVLEINLSDLSTSDTGLLKFQLMNSDGDRGTKISIQPLSNQVDAEGILSDRPPVDDLPLAVGSSTDLSNLVPNTNVKTSVSNVRFDATTGLYQAEIQLRNDGESIHRDVVVVFPGLPNGVSLQSPSGINQDGAPYVNVKPAIGRGGLTSGSWSEPVAVAFSNPGRLPFALKTVVLAASNRAPTLAPIAPLTIMPGEAVNVSLVAEDPDGDPISYSIVSNSTDGQRPTVNLAASGVLTFRPNTSQLGTYQLDVIASDGALEASRSFTVNVVADPLTTTRVSGKILQVNGQPLANMPIQIGSVQGLTRADGSFTLDLGSGAVVSDTIKVRGELFAGSKVYPFIAEKIDFILGHEVYANVNNVIDRPIYLPEIDIANGKTVDPTRDTTVTSSALPGAKVEVAASTLMNQQGSPFTGVLSITDVPISLTPAALPEGLIPDLVVTIQPGEMVFTRPTALSLPNAGGYAPGTRLDLWSINPVTGEFDIVGVGQVSSNGNTVDTIDGGIRNSSWHFFGPPAPTGPKVKDDPRNKKPSSPPACDAATSSCESHSGALIETHDLVTYQSQGTTRGITLTYDSLRADPRPIVHFTFDELDPKNYSVPDAVRLIAELDVHRNGINTEVPGYQGGAYNLQGNKNIWRLPLEAGSVDAALQVDLQGQPTGVYDYSLRSGMLGYAGSRGFIGTLNETRGQFTSVNTTRSPYGAGWGISGLLELVENIDGSVLVVNGNGSELLYTKNPDDSYNHPPGEFADLSKLANGTFRRVWPDQTVEQYNTAKRLLSITDRNENVDHYDYDGDGRLVKITDPVGLETTLVYTGSRIEITDPAGRVTRLNLDVNGNLTRVTDPDGSSRQWRYDSQHHMTGETDQLGNIESANYGFHGRVTDVIRKDGSRRQYYPIDIQGLFPAEQTAADPIVTPLANPVAGRVPQPESFFADVNGNVTRSKLDEFGQVVSAKDSVGTLPSVVRNTDNLPAQTTDASGNPTWFTYDAKGNVLTQATDLGNVERPFGTAFHFDGIDDAVHIPDAPSLRSANITLESWVQFDSIPQVATILAKPLPMEIPNAINGTKFYAASYRIRYENGHLFATVSDRRDDYNYSTIAAPWKPEAGRWHHVAATFDDSSDTLTLYVDGVPVAVGIVVTSIAYVDRPLVIGADLDDDQPARWFPGAIDEVRVWNVARTTDQIRSNMFRAPSSSDIGLVASYSFDSSPDGVVSDSSNNQNHGTVASDGPTVVESTIGNLRPTQSPEGLIGWWSADGHANDLHASYNGVSKLGTFYTPGLVDLGFQFDGVDDYVRVTDGADEGLDTTGDMTINAWINPSTIAGKQRTIVQKRPLAGNNDVTYGFFLESDGTLAFTSRMNGGEFRTVVSQSTIPTNAWSHVAVAIKGSMLEFYVNGIVDARLPYSFTRPSTNGPMTIGSAIVDGVSLDSFHGSIDEVQLLGRALTSEEIRSIAKADRAGQRKPTMFDAALDYTTASNPNGVWQYGSSRSLGAGFQPILSKSPDHLSVVGFTHQSRTVRTQSRISQWVHEIFISGYQAPGFTSSADALALTAGGNGQASVVQWTAPQAGTYRINGHFEGVGLSWWAEPERRSGVNVLFNNNATAPLLSGTTSGEGSEVPFGLMKFLQAGETLQFTVVNADGTSDIVALSATILLEGSSSGNQGGAGADFAKRSYTYDDTYSQLTSVTDELGRKTVRTIDPTNGNVLANTDIVGAVGGNDDATSLFTYTANGQLETVTDPLGHVTKMIYDPFGRTTQIRRAVGTDKETVERFEYDSAGRVTAEVDANGNRTVYAYDAMNRLVTTTFDDGTTVRASYDLRGNMKSSTDPFGNIERQEFDRLDRLTKVVDKGGNATRYSYDSAGNLVAVTSPLNQVTRTSYDARQRPVSTQDSEGSVTRFKYNAKDQLVSVQDARGNKTSYLYDSQGNVTRSIDPLGKTTSYIYDHAQQLVQKIDREGRKTNYSYNDLGQLTRETWQEEDGAIANTIHYTYDALGNLIAANDNFSSVHYQRDALNRIVEHQTAGPNGVPTTFLNSTYDPAGNLLTQSDTINGVVGATNTSAYDSFNRTTQLIQTGPGIAPKRVNFSYNALGQFTSIARFADTAGQLPVISTSFSFDTLNRLTSLTHRNVANTAVNSYQFQYDAANRITRLTDIDGLTQFTYNTRDELLTANHADEAISDETYTYDLTGNRTSSHLHGNRYVTGEHAVGKSDVNRLSSDGIHEYAYDANGNLTTKVEIATGKVREFAFDHRNRLVKVTDRPSATGSATQIVKYTYDLSNRRIGINVDATPSDGRDGQVTHFIYSGDDVIAELTDPDGSGPISPALSMRYLHGPAVDQVLAQETANGDVHWMLSDHLGTVRDIVDFSGELVNHIKYDSYGNVINESHPEVETRYKYTGREFDSETKIQYNRARYYDAALGRFLSEDPLGLTDGMNIYAYVHNQPQQRTDPSGLIGKGDIEWREMGQPKSTPPAGNPLDHIPGNNLPEIGPNVPDRDLRRNLPKQPQTDLGTRFSDLSDAFGRLPDLPDWSNDAAKAAIGIGAGIGATALGGPIAGAAARAAAATLGRAAGPAAAGALGAASPAFAIPGSGSPGSTKEKKRKC